MADLITRERALRSIDNRTLASGEDKIVDALIAAASNGVRRYCRREFVAKEHDELYAGTQSPCLSLREFPIVSVDRVAFDPTTVLRIANTSSANQRATVKVTDTGLTLVRVASGTTTTDAGATFAANTTLGAVQTAINALGNGWSATIPDANYSDWPSADLRALQGALSCKAVAAELRLHIQELSDFDIDAQHGVLLRRAGVWFGGEQYWRIVYTAGFESVPEDVQEACAQWTAALFWQTKRDPGLTQEAIPGAVSRSAMHAIPSQITALLRPYRRYSV